MVVAPSCYIINGKARLGGRRFEPCRGRIFLRGLRVFVTIKTRPSPRPFAFETRAVILFGEKRGGTQALPSSHAAGCYACHCSRSSLRVWFRGSSRSSTVPRIESAGVQMTTRLWERTKARSFTSHVRGKGGGHVSRPSNRPTHAENRLKSHPKEMHSHHPRLRTLVAFRTRANVAARACIADPKGSGARDPRSSQENLTELTLGLVAGDETAT